MQKTKPRKLLKTQSVRRNGYSLIELMIVVALVGIISSIAYSAFTGYTASADRAQAQSDLYELSQIMERSFTDNRTYVLTNAQRNAMLAPFNNNSPRYDYAAPTLTQTTFELTAVATDSRDRFDMRINQRGLEEFRTHGAGTWSNTSGWDNID